MDFGTKQLVEARVASQLQTDLLERTVDTCHVFIDKRWWVVVVVVENTLQQTSVLSKGYKQLLLIHLTLQNLKLALKQRTEGHLCNFTPNKMRVPIV